MLPNQFGGIIISLLLANIIPCAVHSSFRNVQSACRQSNNNNYNYGSGNSGSAAATRNNKFAPTFSYLNDGSQIYTLLPSLFLPAPLSVSRAKYFHGKCYSIWITRAHRQNGYLEVYTACAVHERVHSMEGTEAFIHIGPL